MSENATTRPTDPRGGMQNVPDASLIAMCDNGACRDLNTGSLTPPKFY